MKIFLTLYLCKIEFETAAFRKECWLAGLGRVKRVTNIQEKTIVLLCCCEGFAVLLFTVSALEVLLLESWPRWVPNAIVTEAVRQRRMPERNWGVSWSWAQVLSRWWLRSFPTVRGLGNPVNSPFTTLVGETFWCWAEWVCNEWN